MREKGCWEWEITGISNGTKYSATGIPGGTKHSSVCIFGCVYADSMEEALELGKNRYSFLGRVIGAHKVRRNGWGELD